MRGYQVEGPAQEPAQPEDRVSPALGPPGGALARQATLGNSAVSEELGLGSAKQSRGAGPPAPASPNTSAADDELRRLQARARDDMAGDVGRVHPQGARNRGPEIDQINREAGWTIPADPTVPGRDWCGAGVGHYYSRANAECNPGDTRRFRSADRIASDDKAEHFFLYRAEHPGGAQDQRNDTREAEIHEQHRQQGSERRFMRFNAGATGPDGQRDRSGAEIYHDRRAMPVRAGDTVVESWDDPEHLDARGRPTHHGHVAMVESYDPDEVYYDASDRRHEHPHRGVIHTLDANGQGGGISRGRMPIDSPRLRGVGRPALGDMQRTPRP